MRIGRKAVQISRQIRLLRHDMPDQGRVLRMAHNQQACGAMPRDGLSQLLRSLV